jgi:L,D-transpeptidase ErfK/SrfK
MRILFIIFLIALTPLYSYATNYVIEGDTIGQMQEYKPVKGDNLYSIARKFDLGSVELIAANRGVTPKNLHTQQKIIIPTLYILPNVERKGIVINLSELRLYYFADDKNVLSFPIGIGKEGWRTPTGTAEITLKRENPTWTPPESIRAANPDLPEFVPPGPKNPLGKYAMSLNLSGIAIHGTNKPSSIGSRASHGCIRMYPEDIEMLFHSVSEGTTVNIIDQNYKVGWMQNRLLMEITPTQEQTDVIAKYMKTKPVDVPEVYEVLANFLGDITHLDKTMIEDTIKAHSGVPIEVYAKNPAIEAITNLPLIHH